MALPQVFFLFLLLGSVSCGQAFAQTSTPRKSSDTCIGAISADLEQLNN